MADITAGIGTHLVLAFALAASAAAADPVVSLNGAGRMTLERGAVFSDPGAVARDLEDGDLTRSIMVFGSVDASTIGTYVITYSVTDSDRNSGSATRIVDVVDTPPVLILDSPPVVFINGQKLMPWPLSNAYVDPGAKASDAQDGDLTSRIVVKGIVDVATPGSYTLVYSVTDSAGNLASATRMVQVIAPPTVTCSTDVKQLSWTGGRMTDVALHWQADTMRTVTSVTCSVTQDEGLAGQFDAELTLTDGMPDHLLLRNAREANQDGRVYLITIIAIDDLGQVGRGSCCVVVPKGGSQKQLQAVQAQAAAALRVVRLAVDSFGLPSANG